MFEFICYFEPLSFEILYYTAVEIYRLFDWQVTKFLRASISLSDRDVRIAKCYAPCQQFSNILHQNAFTLLKLRTLKSFCLLQFLSIIYHNICHFLTCGEKSHPALEKSCYMAFSCLKMDWYRDIYYKFQVIFASEKSFRSFQD